MLMTNKEIILLISELLRYSLINDSDTMIVQYIVSKRLQKEGIFQSSYALTLGFRRTNQNGISFQTFLQLLIAQCILSDSMHNVHLYLLPSAIKTMRVPPSSVSYKVIERLPKLHYTSLFQRQYLIKSRTVLRNILQYFNKIIPIVFLFLSFDKN